jgi:hypothetical protein
MFRRIFRTSRRRVFASRPFHGEQEKSMIFGHNSNLKLGSITFHIQTEDRGEPHALIDSTVYYEGRVLHRRVNNYFDLLPMNEDREQALKLRLEAQHHTVIEEIRSGQLQLAIPPPTILPAKAPAPSAVSRPVPEPRKISLELTNAKSWFSGKHAKLLVTVREQNGDPVPGAQIAVEIDGSDDHVSYRASTGAQGQALVEFEMPRITGADPALAIYAEDRDAKAHLRFALRAKPRVA